MDAHSAGSAEKEIIINNTLETTADELKQGTLFAGRCEIIEELGVGGTGRVYRAFDKKIEGGTRPQVG